MSDFSIRPATPADEQAIASVVHAAYAPYRVNIPDLPDVAGGIGDDIRDNVVIVAATEERILGAAVLILGKYASKLANIAVHPDQGGRGLGRALISAVESEARLSGASRLDLATHSSMPENVALYSRLGWTEIDRDGTRVFMTKSLS